MKNTNIQIRSSEEFKKEVIKKAESIGLTVSAYITMLIKKDLKNKA